jgi:hypothetical protein
LEYLMFARTNPAPVSPAFLAAYPDHDGAAGAIGWPLVASPTYPGETTLACPACGSVRVELTTRPGGHGTGPGGRWRMGDPGGAALNRCAACGHRATAEGALTTVTTRDRWDRRAVFYPADSHTGSDRYHDAPASFHFDRAGYYVWRYDASALGSWVAYGPFRTPDSRACRRAVTARR